MSLVSLDDSFFDHPKAAEAGEDAANLYVRGLAYCRRYNTGGRIPKGALSKLTAKRDAAKHAADCVRSGLWSEDEHAWHVHDYEVWYKNDPGTKLEKQRKLAASRAKNYRDGKRDAKSPDTPPSRDEERDASRDGLRDDRGTSDATDTPRSVTNPASRAGTRASPNTNTNSNQASPQTPEPAGGDIDPWEIQNRVQTRSRERIEWAIVGSDKELTLKRTARSLGVEKFTASLNALCDMAADDAGLEQLRAEYKGALALSAMLGRGGTDGSGSADGLLMCFRIANDWAKKRATPKPAPKVYVAPKPTGAVLSGDQIRAMRLNAGGSNG